VVKIDNAGTESRSAPRKDQIPAGSADQRDVSSALKIVGKVCCCMARVTIKEIN
jgi:hypothetical protein